MWVDLRVSVLRRQFVVVFIIISNTARYIEL